MRMLKKIVQFCKHSKKIRDKAKKLQKMQQQSHSLKDFFGLKNQSQFSLNNFDQQLQFNHNQKQINQNQHQTHRLQLQKNHLQVQNNHQNQQQNNIKSLQFLQKNINQTQSTIQPINPHSNHLFYQFVSQYIPTHYNLFQSQNQQSLQIYQKQMESHSQSTHLKNNPTQSLLNHHQKQIQTPKQIEQNYDSHQNFLASQQNPFAPYNQQLFQQLSTATKNIPQPQSYKSHSTKRKQRLQKIRAQLKDPQLRRQRNRQRHLRQKIKLQKNLQGMNQEQARQYLDARKKAKQELKQKVKLYSEKQLGLPFLIDIAFQHKMNQKQNKSLTAQIQLIVRALKTIEHPPNVHLCGLKQGPVKDQLVKMQYQHWPIKSYDQDIRQILQQQKFKNKNVYYLSPDASQTLQTITKDDVFIIGGLVDRTVIKYASYNRALEIGVPSRSLPIRPFMKQRNCLNLDHIVNIVCKYAQIHDWKQAFEYGAPKRWKKQQGEAGLRLHQNSDNDQYQNEKQTKEQKQFKQKDLIKDKKQGN